MFKKYYPSQYINSVFDIDFQKLYDMGYRGILFDVDNTLVHHGEDSNERVDRLIDSVRKIGFKVILLSDNSRARLERFVQNTNCPFIEEAGKPDPTNYLRAVKELGISKPEAICIGDQIFTDICGANRSCIDSILVHFVQVKEKEWIGLRRYLEKLILTFYRFSKQYNRLGNIERKGE
ncbi:MAG: YqeG family HAD IIIA-type phosphatase [Clostridia bacterium]|nr:YqeG family HAD IIIA-type phosphatase [Clostridia bacterium]